MYDTVLVILAFITAPLFLLIVAISPNIYICLLITFLMTIAPFVFHKIVLAVPILGYIFLFFCLINILIKSYNRSINSLTLSEEYFLFRIDSIDRVQSFFQFFNISPLKKFDILDSIEHIDFNISKITTGSTIGSHYHILAPQRWLFATTRKYKYGWIDISTFRLFNPHIEGFFEHSSHLYVLFACCTNPPLGSFPIDSIRYFIGLSEASSQAIIIPEKYYSDAVNQHIQIIGFSLSEGYTIAQLKELGYLQ